MAAKKEKTDTPEIKEQLAGDAAGPAGRDSADMTNESLLDPYTPTEVRLQPQMSEEYVQRIVRKMGFVSKDALTPMIAQAVDVHIRGLNLEATLAPLAALLEEAETHRDKPEGIQAILVASMFNCPLCNMRLDGPSGTSIQGKGVDYSHPFGESPKLNGGRCEYQGRKFKTPTIFLELQPKPQPKTQPLTAITE